MGAVGTGNQGRPRCCLGSGTKRTKRYVLKQYFFVFVFALHLCMNLERSNSLPTSSSPSLILGSPLNSDIFFVISSLVVTCFIPWVLWVIPVSESLGGVCSDGQRSSGTLPEVFAQRVGNGARKGTAVPGGLLPVRRHLTGVISETSWGITACSSRLVSKVHLSTCHFPGTL